MLSRIKTATLVGVNGYPVTVETDIHSGMPDFRIVGLADTTIRESYSRVKPAVLNSGFSFPDRKVTVNLVPAGRPKEGSHFDLPVALGIIMQETGCVDISDTAFFGELSLDGRLNRIKGALPLVMCMRKAGIRNIVLPEGNAEEAAILEDVNIFPAACLSDVASFLSGKCIPEVYIRKEKNSRQDYSSDFSQVIGQESAKRAIVIGAAGGHGILFMGGPGCGKTMLAKRIPSVLPDLTYEEKIEITGIYSIAGLLSEEEPVVTRRPFRSPHHTISAVGLTGGGTKPRPGELSLAHGGVLFLDELGEFDSKAIDAMRQPVEEGFVRINRNMEEMIFPSKTMIVAAANPCKCGYLWDDKRVCTCSRRQLEAHRRRLAGPFSDRIDMHIKVMPIQRDSIGFMNEDMASVQEQTGTSSEEMRRQVMAARAVQEQRYAGTAYSWNGSLDEKGIEIYCKMNEDCRKLLGDAYERYGLSMRACMKLFKISRTIADLAGEEKIRSEHVAEALVYRITDWDRKK